MPTFQELLQERAAPVIAMDQEGLVIFLNESFEKEYGWRKGDLLGRQLVNAIIPSEMQDAHRIGFSRFLSTQSPTLLNRPLKLPIVCKDGRIRNVEHLIVAEQRDGRWMFAARITPEAGPEK